MDIQSVYNTTCYHDDKGEERISQVDIKVFVRESHKDEVNIALDLDGFDIAVLSLPIEKAVELGTKLIQSAKISS